MGDFGSLFGFRIDNCCWEEERFEFSSNSTLISRNSDKMTSSSAESSSSTRKIRR